MYMYLTTVIYLQLSYNSYQTTAQESSKGQGVLQSYMYRWGLVDS